jgi:hypothetical protein
MRQPQRLRPVEGGISEEEQMVAAILNEAGATGSRVYMIIYPYHAQLRMMIERLGLGELFTEWKKLIVAIATEQVGQGGRVEVWDFSGIASKTTEEIPARGDRQTQLKYYWESGHFKKALGDLVIARLFGEINDFGIKLDRDNIDAWLVEDRNKVQALLATPSPLLSEVEDIIARTQSQK